MSMLLHITCDVCKKKEQEKYEGAGFSDWGRLMGITLNDVANPNLCPEHLSVTAAFVDRLVIDMGGD